MAHRKPSLPTTNSYNGTRALRIDVGFMREHCENGVIFEQEAATLTVPHTCQGIHSISSISIGLPHLRTFTAGLFRFRVEAIGPGSVG